MELGTSEMTTMIAKVCTDTANWWESFPDASSGKNLPEFFVNRQKQARKHLCTAGLPTFAEEDWKYTNLSQLRRLVLGQPSDCFQHGQCFERKFSSTDSVTVIDIVDGQVDPACLHQNHKGVLNLYPLSQASTAVSTVIEASLARDQDQNFTELLAFAKISDALCIHVTSGQAAEQMIHLRYKMVSSDISAHTLAFVVVDEGVNCKILETFEGACIESSLINSVSRVIVADHAHCSHLRVLEDASSNYHFSSACVDVGQAATYSALTTCFGSKMTRNDLRCRLLGERGHVTLLGANVLSREQHVDNHTVLDHIAPNCTSLEVYKGIYAEKSKGIFDGTIIVRPGAQKTNAIQSSRALLLSSESASYSKPQLKIWADDVKCTHGAAVGQIDEQALFYLRSRGIPQAEARVMLSKAFISEVSASFPEAELGQWVDDIMSDYLVGLLGN